MQRLWGFLKIGLVIVCVSAGLAALLLIASSQGSPSGRPASASTLGEALANFPIVFAVFRVVSVGAVWYKNRGNWL